MKRYGKRYFTSDEDSWYAAALADWDAEDERRHLVSDATPAKASASSSDSPDAAAYLKEHYNYTLGDIANLASARTPGTIATPTTPAAGVARSITPSNLASTSSILGGLGGGGLGGVPSPSAFLSTFSPQPQSISKGQGAGSENYAAQAAGTASQYRAANQQNLAAEGEAEQSSLKSTLIDRYAKKAAELKGADLNAKAVKAKKRVASRNLLSLNSTSFFNNPSL